MTLRYSRNDNSYLKKEEEIPNVHQFRRMQFGRKPSVTDGSLTKILDFGFSYLSTGFVIESIS